MGKIYGQFRTSYNNFLREINLMTMNIKDQEEKEDKSKKENNVKVSSTKETNKET